MYIYPLLCANYNLFPLSQFHLYFLFFLSIYLSLWSWLASLATPPRIHTLRTFNNEWSNSRETIHFIGIALISFNWFQFCSLHVFSIIHRRNWYMQWSWPHSCTHNTSKINSVRINCQLLRQQIQHSISPAFVGMGMCNVEFYWHPQCKLAASLYRN